MQPSADSPLVWVCCRETGRTSAGLWCSICSDCTVAIAGALSSTPQWRPGWPCLRLTLGCQCRLWQAAVSDAALCPTVPGQIKVALLARTRNLDGVWMELRRPTDALLAVIVGLWPDLSSLLVTGEQRQRLQAIDIRVYRG